MLNPLTSDQPNSKSPAKMRSPSNYLQHTKPIPRLKKESRTFTQSNPSQLAGQHNEWFRITLYEITGSKAETVRVGTLFSQNITLLSAQLTKTIRLKWDFTDKFHVSADITSRELRMDVTPKKTLLVVFDAPNKQTTRAVSQNFSRFARAIKSDLSGTKPEKSP